MSATVPAANDEPDRLPRRLHGPPRGVGRGPAVSVMPRRRLLFAGATWCAMRAVAEEPVEARSALRVTTRAGGATRVLDGRMIVEAADGGLLLELVDPALQSLLVAVDESSAARGPLDPQERMNHLEDALRRRSAQRQAHASARTLKTSQLDAGSEAELLERLVAQRRVAQGMTEPKDG